MADSKPPPFFVGYQPMPPQLKRFYWPLAVLLVVACGVAGYWAAAQQKSPAPALWDTARTTTMHGILTNAPYPVLHRINPEKPATLESVLLVRQGKHAADEFSARHAGQAVSVSGYRIRRGGWSMLEVPGEDAIRRDTDEQAAELQSLLVIEPLGNIELVGEIVDSKCFLGVMKPGAGKVHKACAELCLLGGIPPMLVVGDADDQRFGYIVVRADGSSASELLAKFAGEPVRVTGRLQRQGDLLFIRMDEDGIRRI